MIHRFHYSHYIFTTVIPNQQSLSTNPSRGYSSFFFHTLSWIQWKRKTISESILALLLNMVFFWVCLHCSRVRTPAELWNHWQENSDCHDRTSGGSLFGGFMSRQQERATYRKCSTATWTGKVSKRKCSTRGIIVASYSFPLMIRIVWSYGRVVFVFRSKQ